MPFTVTIIGMGLIGGSLAYALKGFQDAHIIGVDICERTRQKALENAAVSQVTADPCEGISNADLVIFCLYPEQITQVIEQNAEFFKSGAVITDVCGVKEPLIRQVKVLLPENVGYVPCHPMAGKELGGFDNADGTLFRGAGFLITPPGDAKQEHIDLIEQLARYIGAADIVCCPPDRHDGIIAYTSHLPHLTAAALCMDPPTGVSKAFTAGSFRESTRVANINSEMWSDLFIQNREHTVRELEKLQNSIESLKNAIQNEDKPALKSLLEKAGEKKRKML